jgi:hypothetical protein
MARTHKCARSKDKTRGAGQQAERGEAERGRALCVVLLGSLTQTRNGQRQQED